MTQNMNGPAGSNGITDANYLYLTLVGDRSKGEASSIPFMEDFGHVLYESPNDGRRIVIGCGGSVPKVSNSKWMESEFGGMSEVEMMEEMFLNGMGSKMEFTDSAYIRVVGPDRKVESVVFTDYRDALAYLGEN